MRRQRIFSFGVLHRFFSARGQISSSAGLHGDDATVWQVQAAGAGDIICTETGSWISWHSSDDLVAIRILGFAARMR